MSIKLKVLKIEDTPKNCTRRVVLSHDDGQQEWVREYEEMTFRLWSNVHGKRGDMVYDPQTKKRYEVDSPFEDVLDEDGYETGEQKLKDGLIAFPVDIYEHSGIAWALQGEGGPCFACPWDTTHAAFWLYVDKDRWERLCGNCEWKFVDGKPTPELLEKAREIARSEIHAMNLCEEGAYYGYVEEVRTTTKEHQIEVVNDLFGTSELVHVKERVSWDDEDSCWGYLTEKPAEEVDFPLGCPVVSANEYLIGDTFEQECWALSDDMTGKFVKLDGDSFRLVDDPIQASLFCRTYLASNRKHFEDDLKKALTVVDVTERIWSRFPECRA